MAGTITYIAPVDYGQGKIFGKKNKWIAVKRNYGNKQKGCAYGGVRDLVNHPVTNDEKTQRSTFAIIAKNVAKRRKHNSPTFEQDMAAYMTQRDQPGGIGTFVKWLWADEQSKL